MTPNDLSIIIPLAPFEDRTALLLNDLQVVAHEVEILLVGTKNDTQLDKLKAQFPQVKIVYSAKGRAYQLNVGALEATRGYLWFLHADSRLQSQTVQRLLSQLKRYPNDLHYFNLKFLPDGPIWMFLNTIGCWIRSRFLKTPFGDQGFCLSKQNYVDMGGFDEKAAYGEDHLFVWKAHEKKINLRPTKMALKTSARKYQDRGWFYTTSLYVKLWIKQAYPQWLKLKTQ